MDAVLRIRIQTAYDDIGVPFNLTRGLDRRAEEVGSLGLMMNLHKVYDAYTYLCGLITCHWHMLMIMIMHHICFPYQV